MREGSSEEVILELSSAGQGGVTLWRGGESRDNSYAWMSGEGTWKYCRIEQAINVLNLFNYCFKRF